VKAALALLAAIGGVVPAFADEDPRLAGSIVYARGGSLYKADTRGKGEVEVAKLPENTSVRALRTDAKGSTLLVDLGGKWSWMKLDGKALLDLPCADGPAQLANDGACVLCRSAADANKSVIINLATNKATPIPVPPPGARLVGDGANRKLVWADATGVWSAPPGQLTKKTKVAPETPLRGFLPAPDGSRAVGVYSDVVHEGKTTKPAEMLMGFALDGQGARRKTVKASLPIEWSFDSQWVLLQDGSTACITRAMGGQYKCWRGFIATSISPDGAYALLLGARDVKPAKKDSKKKKKPVDEDTESDEPVDDVNVPPPTGPVALYRAKLDGAFAESPSRIVQVVEGSAVWIPSR
jgi:hypothetical protein